MPLLFIESIMLADTTLLILAAAGFAAGLVNAIAGAGGLLTLPLLLWAGIPPLAALGTNKFQAVFGTLASSYNYFRQGHLSLDKLMLPLSCAFAGSIVGSLVVQQLSLSFLQLLVPILLIATACYYAFSPRVSDHDSKAILSQQSFNLFIVAALGFFSGFFGPGTGLFFAAALSGLLGYGALKATAHAKPLVLICNSSSLLVFVFAGHISWPAAIVMSLAQMLGGRLGSQLAIKKGHKLIRPVVILAAISLAVASLISD